MNFVKKYLKIVIGICVLILAIVVFFMAQRTSDLEGGTLKTWRAASLERRTAAVKILTASDANSDLLVKCVDKMSTLPDSGEMAIRDAVSLCYTGLQLKDNI